MEIRGGNGECHRLQVKRGVQLWIGLGDRIKTRSDIQLWLQHYFEYAVLAFGIGIGLYFSLPVEPVLRWIILINVVLLVFLFFLVRRRPSALMIAGLALMVVIGLARSTWHTHATAAAKLPRYEKVYDVSGRITAIEKSGPRLRWVVKIRSLDDLSQERRPKYVRVTTFDKEYSVGDLVSFRAQLRAPPEPVIPGGYNPAFRAYFDQVGGYGFMLSRPQKTSLPVNSVRESLSIRVAKIRYGMAKRILDKAPEETAGLQVALLTGIRTWVPDDQTDALRAAGLAHILAISGLHMGLVTGSIYGIAMFFLVRIDRLARARDVRKIAAVIGLLTATAYLILSGASVATQRAYIMACIVFLALILDRQAISIRSVSVAAFITLWLHPEALVSPGFQMSFSAVLALVVVYRYWDSRRVYRTRPGIAGRIWDNFKALSITSLVAGTATSGFAVLHFNRIAVYGFFANLLAMPFFTFWVMPVAILVYAAMPFGLEAGPLWLMGQGISIIIVISKWVEGLAGSVSFMSSGPFWVMGLFGLSFIGMCIGEKRVKWMSVLAMTLCFGTLIFRGQADIRISSSGAIAFWDSGEDPVLYVDKKNTDRYGRQEFIEAMGVGSTLVKGYDGDIGRCDDQSCLVEFKDMTFLIVSDPSEMLEDCHLVDMIIAPKRTLGKRVKRLCDKPIIDARDLQNRGAHSLYLSPEKTIKVRRARRSLPARPWH